MNHVLLDGKGVSEPIYIILIILRFMQVCCFILFNMKILNEFNTLTTEYSSETTKLGNLDLSNMTSGNATYASNSTSDAATN